MLLAVRGGAFGVPPKAYKDGVGERPRLAGVFHGLERQSRTRRSDGIVLRLKAPRLE